MDKIGREHWEKRDKEIKKKFALHLRDLYGTSDEALQFVESNVIPFLFPRLPESDPIKKSRSKKSRYNEKRRFL